MRAFVVILGVLAMAAPAAADDGNAYAPARAKPEPPYDQSADAAAAYAIVVGANRGGAGQTDLRFAEDDARRVADLLAELANYPRAGIAVVTSPQPANVLAAIDKLETAVRRDRDAGIPTTVFFYYSGHAKATALNLGAAELELSTLRERLLAVPANLTVVVLDACQSGAFSRVKGGEPAADFSFNSKSRLDATGVAVLASSTGSELSQESDRLKSSYFTHHLLVGLRGAADSSKDGRVTIDEAYRYAYHQTLLATAATAVGSQHVSLEVDLKGHGEVPLSFPQKATASLELPASVAGEVLVERVVARAVIAEIHKAKGNPLRVAVAPGDYVVMIRRDKRLDHCPTSVRGRGVTAVDLGACKPAPFDDGGVKGGARYEHPLAIEIGVSLGSEVGDAFTDRLADFGYRKQFVTIASRLALTARYPVHPYVEVGGSLAMTGSPTYERETTDGDPLTFEWQTTALSALARINYPLLTRLRPFGQLAAGIGYGKTILVDEMAVEHTEGSFGPVLGATGGLEYDSDWFPRFGASLSYTFAFAPLIENVIGDNHLGLGHWVGLDLHYRFRP
jgi:hypothetical protein